MLKIKLISLYYKIFYPEYENEVINDTLYIYINRPFYDELIFSLNTEKD